MEGQQQENPSFSPVFARVLRGVTTCVRTLVISLFFLLVVSIRVTNASDATRGTLTSKSERKAKMLYKMKNLFIL